MNTITFNTALNPFQRSSHVPNASCGYYNEHVVGISQSYFISFTSYFLTLLPQFVDAL